MQDGREYDPKQNGDFEELGTDEHADTVETVDADTGDAEDSDVEVKNQYLEQRAGELALKNVYLNNMLEEADADNAALLKELQAHRQILEDAVPGMADNLREVVNDLFKLISSLKESVSTHQNMVNMILEKITMTTQTVIPTINKLTMLKAVAIHQPEAEGDAEVPPAVSVVPGPPKPE